MAVKIIKATGSVLSASTGTQYIPFDSTIINEGAEFAVASTSAVSAATGGVYRVNTSISLNPVDFTSQTVSLNLRRNGADPAGADTSARGFGEIDSIQIAHQAGANRFNRGKSTLDRDEAITLQGSTVVSADAGDEIGAYITGSLESTTVVSSITVDLAD